MHTMNRNLVSHFGLRALAALSIVIAMGATFEYGHQLSLAAVLMPLA